MYSLKLTKDARSDLSDIRRYTIKQFGESQYQTYRSRLETGLQHLIEHPEIGFEVDELEAGYRCFAVQHHRIFYRIDTCFAAARFAIDSRTLCAITE